MNAWLLVAWLGCQTLDATTTAWGLQHGFREVNPVLRGRAGLPIKISINVGALMLSRKLESRQRRMVAGTFAATGCAAGAWNLHQVRR